MSDQAITISPEEMEARTVRFKEQKARPKRGAGVLRDEIVNFFVADANYSYMAPEMEGRSQIQRFAALVGGDAGNAISISMAVASPGRGPTLHHHMKTVEAFFCLSSKFEISWGDKGENAIVLEPWDFVHVPVGVARTFKNVGDVEGAVLVIIQGNMNEFDDVVRAPYVAEQITARFGAGVIDEMAAAGVPFDEPMR